MGNQYNKKYPKVKDYWLYVHRTPDNMYYPGCSMQSVSRRWKVGQYRKTGLEDSINKFGWDNIEHIILMDGLTKEEALYWEDKLICMYTQLGCCLNKQRSGGHTKQYHKEYYEKHKEYLKEKQKQRYELKKEEIQTKIKEYHQTHKEEISEYQKRYQQEHQEELKEYRRQYYQKTKDGLD